MCAIVVKIKMNESVVNNSTFSSPSFVSGGSAEVGICVGVGFKCFLSSMSLHLAMMHCNKRQTCYVETEMNPVEASC